jgi:hypothetical protein
MAEALPVQPPDPDPPLTAANSAQPSRQVPRVVAWGLLALLGAYVVWQAPVLFKEWVNLRREWNETRTSQVVGYVDISPQFSMASRPNEWIRRDGDSLLLWAGWVDNVGHEWFRLPVDHLDPKILGDPIGRDSVRAIDYPIVEVGGGVRWGRLIEETPVIAVEVGGVPTVYPMMLLQKVEVVNDTVGDRPVLVVYSPFLPENQSVDLYDPVVDGNRLTLGSSGYFVGQRPVLYDRKSESFWVKRDRSLVALAGRYKGTELKHLAHQAPVTWGDWYPRHPRSRLVIGADRKKPRPDA